MWDSGLTKKVYLLVIKERDLVFLFEQKHYKKGQVYYDSVSLFVTRSSCENYFV